MKQENLSVQEESKNITQDPNIKNIHGVPNTDAYPIRVVTNQLGTIFIQNDPDVYSR